MKTRTFVSILILVLAILIISSCATTSKVFLKPVRAGDYAEVKRLIEQGADLNAQDNEGGTAVIKASEYEHTELTQHVPLRHKHLIRYYGLYSSRTKGKGK